MKLPKLKYLPFKLLVLFITTKYAATTGTLFHCPKEDDLEKHHGKFQGVIFKCFMFL